MSNFFIFSDRGNGRDNYRSRDNRDDRGYKSNRDNYRRNSR